MVKDIPPDLLIQKVKELDNQVFQLSQELDPRGAMILSGNGINKWIAKDKQYIYKAMDLEALSRLTVSWDFIEMLDFSCFEPFEIIYKGNILAIIKQRRFQRIDLNENSNGMQAILQKEIETKYPDIEFYPFKNLTSYQLRFYLDYPQEFYKLMKFIKTFDVRDCIEFSNCGIDPDTNKIKCFDIELQGRYSVEKIEDFVRKYSNQKDFAFPSIVKFVRH